MAEMHLLRIDYRYLATTVFLLLLAVVFLLIGSIHKQRDKKEFLSGWCRDWAIEMTTFTAGTL